MKDVFRVPESSDLTRAASSSLCDPITNFRLTFLSRPSLYVFIT